MTVVRDQLFPQKPPGSRFRFSRTGVQPPPGSSTIELPSAFAESGAYPPDSEPPGSPRQCSLPLACRHPPEGHQIGARKRRTPENTILSQPYCRRVSTDRSDGEGSQLAASLEGEPGPTPAGKTLPHSYSETKFRRERARDLSNANPARGHKEARRSTGHIISYNPLLKPTGIQIATKSLPGPTTREHRKIIDRKTMSLGTNYSFYSLECCRYFRILFASYREKTV